LVTVFSEVTAAILFPGSQNRITMPFSVRFMNEAG
jgi:hypothetical protein